MATQSTPTPYDAEYAAIKAAMADAFVLDQKLATAKIAHVFASHVAAIRLCTVCSEAISAARLKAKPGADTCVPCLEAKGDVPRLRRFDETSAQGTVETLFTSDANLAHQLNRQRQTVPGYRAENAGPSFHEEYFTAAVQDAEITTEPDEETEL